MALAIAVADVFFLLLQKPFDEMGLCSYINCIANEFDPAKDAANRSKHGVSLGEFTGFDDEPNVVVDDRFEYGETRYQARGRINGKGYCLVFVETPDGSRLISLRRAREKEIRRNE